MPTRSGSRRKPSSQPSLLKRITQSKPGKAPSTQHSRPTTTHKPPLATIFTNDLGVTSRTQHDAMTERYLNSLSARKRPKALINQSMFDDIWDVLHEPANSRVRTPQFRFWVRKSFKLARLPRDGPGSSSGDGSNQDTISVVTHEDRPVAVKSQIYDVIAYYHVISGHGGRDRTMEAVRDNYSWIPKELVAQFVKQCPTCVLKKTGNLKMASSMCSGLTTDSLEGGFSGENYFKDGDGDVIMESGSAMLQQLAGPTQGASFQIRMDSPSLFCSRVLPPLNSSGLTPTMPSLPMTDPYQWLSDLTHQAGPNFPAISPQLPPLRRFGGKNNGNLDYHSRVTLPSLVKALSENHADTTSSLMYPDENMEPHSQAPLQRSCDSMFGMNSLDSADSYPSDSSLYSGEFPLDPVLLAEDSCFCPSYSAYPPPYGQSKLIPGFPETFDFQGGRLFPADWSSDESAGSLDNLAARSSAPSPEPMPLDSMNMPMNMVERSTTMVVQPSLSFDPQDWESTYVLEDVPCW